MPSVRIFGRKRSFFVAMMRRERAPQDHLSPSAGASAGKAHSVPVSESNRSSSLLASLPGSTSIGCELMWHVAGTGLCAPVSGVHRVTGLQLLQANPIIRKMNTHNPLVIPVASTILKGTPYTPLKMTRLVTGALCQVQLRPQVASRCCAPPVTGKVRGAKRRTPGPAQATMMMLRTSYNIINSKQTQFHITHNYVPLSCPNMIPI